MIKQEKPVNSVLSNIGASYINLIIGIAIGIIVTRSLGPELKGEYAGLRLLIDFYAPFLLFGYHGGVLYNGIKKNISIENVYWSGSIIVIILSVFAITILYFLAITQNLGSILYNVDRNVLILTLLLIPVAFLNIFSEKILLINSLFKLVNNRIIAANLIILIFYLYNLIYNELTLKLTIIGISIGYISQYLMNLFFIVFYVKINFTISLSDIFKPFNYGIKNWLNQILSVANDKIDQILISFLLNATSFGLYSVGVAISNLVALIPSSYIPVFYNQISDKNTTDALMLFTRAQRITLVFSLLTVLILSLLAYPLVYFLYGKSFGPASLVVIFYSPGLIFQIASRLNMKLYAGIGKPLKNSLVYVFGVILSLPFYFWLIPKFGIYGAAISSSLTYFFAFLFSFYQINREFQLKIKDILLIQTVDINFISAEFSKLFIKLRNYLKFKNK